MSNQHMMKNNLCILLTFLFPLFISLPGIFSSQTHILQWYCKDNVGNYSANSLYQDNLNLLLTSLTSQASSALFGHDKAGVGADDVNMLYSCRGDLYGQDCQDCISEAAKTIVMQCPNQKEAIVWYEECMLRYANRPIFNREEETPFVWSYSNASEISDPLRFDQVLVNTVGELVKDAAYNQSKGGYAIGEGDLPLSVASNLKTFNKVYCLAQCTPDILGTRCERCLRAAFSAMAGCCGTARQSLLVYFPSCQLRYSIIPFVRGTGMPISPANLTPPASPKKESSGGVEDRMRNFDGWLLILGLVTAVTMLVIKPTST